MSDIKKLFDLQKKYNLSVFGKDEINTDLLERHTQDLALCAHAEISSLISATKYKRHHKNSRENNPDMNTILYESVDVIRYIMAILNLWDVDVEKFQEAFTKKNTYLNARREIDNHSWKNEKVVIVDMDDVIVDFRMGFSEWLFKKHEVIADVSSKEYYFIDALRKKNLNPELTFLDFVSEGGFSSLPAVSGAKKLLQSLRGMGYWIQILTARPEENLQCKYDTYHWLSENQMPFDDLAFASEKFRWCAQSRYYDGDNIAFAIDDSPKHVSEYVKHGIECWTPKKSYNEEVWEKDNVFLYDNLENFIKSIKS